MEHSIQSNQTVSGYRNLMLWLIAWVSEELRLLGQANNFRINSCM